MCEYECACMSMCVCGYAHVNASLYMCRHVWHVHTCAGPMCGPVPWMRSVLLLPRSLGPHHPCSCRWSQCPWEQSSVSAWWELGSLPLRWDKESCATPSPGGPAGLSPTPGLSCFLFPSHFPTPTSASGHCLPKKTLAFRSLSGPAVGLLSPAVHESEQPHACMNVMLIV